MYSGKRDATARCRADAVLACVPDKEDWERGPGLVMVLGFGGCWWHCTRSLQPGGKGLGAVEKRYRVGRRGVYGLQFSRTEYNGESAVGSMGKSVAGWLAGPDDPSASSDSGRTPEPPRTLFASCLRLDWQRWRAASGCVQGSPALRSTTGQGQAAQRSGRRGTGGWAVGLGTRLETQRWRKVSPGTNRGVG